VDRKLLLAVIFALALASCLLFSCRVSPVKAADPIHINSDGSISKPANIATPDNVTYAFTDNINDAIVVDRENIMIDGYSYTLQNPGGLDNGILINSDNVTIKNLKIKGFSNAVFLYLVTQCKIIGNTLTENVGAISTQLSSSSGIIISGNRITNNSRGIYLQGGSDNYIYGNDIIGQSQYAIRIHFSAENNAIYDNNIVDNDLTYYSGASILISGASQNNIFYHNNMIGHSPLAYFENDWRPNSWNNGSVGNYWSTYKGQDSDEDGIGDTPYNMSSANVDNYPLMSQIGTITRDFAPYSQEVTLASNSTVQNFQFSDTLKQISFNVTGVTGTSGYCDITFAKTLLSGTIIVTKNDVPLTQDVEYTQTDNSTHCILHITYTHSTHLIKIIGTVAIPEFSPSVLLTLLITGTMLALILQKTKSKRSPTPSNIF
jgi:parallel beta-helix repeat protein